MKGKNLVRLLYNKMKVKDNPQDLALRIGKQPQVIKSWNDGKITPLQIATVIAKLESRVIRASNLLSLIRKKLNIATDADTAKLLGLSIPTLRAWKSEKMALNCKQLVRVLCRTREQAQKTAFSRVIKPIVEFYPITLRQHGVYEVFQMKNENETTNQYPLGLKEALEKATGIYIFYDSRGHALYVGQTTKQSIWKEMNYTFKKSRDKVQKIKIVTHPTSDVPFRPASEKRRQPKLKSMKLYELARYFSAYKVDVEIIADLEALLVRGFCNDVLNTKMEGFATNITPLKKHGHKKTRRSKNRSR
ncbi:MAG: hypothetical protein WCE90_10155 [Candidatus Zixiibacteriota bacterium]